MRRPENNERVHTTFFEDFTIADLFGETAIKDTYERSMAAWKDNYKYLTELVMTLNWKAWEWSNSRDDERCRLYSDLYEQANDYAYEHLKGEELTFYFNVTD